MTYLLARWMESLAWLRAFPEEGIGARDLSRGEASTSALDRDKGDYSP